MEKTIDSKRKSRNLSEKKRRDQFNNLINELNNLIDPHFNNQNIVDDDDDVCASSQQQAALAANNRLATGLPDYCELGEYQHQQTPTSATALNRNDLFDLNTQRSTNNQRPYGSLLTSKSNKAASSSSSLAGSSKQRKMDKSSVLKCAMEFLKQHAAPQSSLAAESNNTSGAGDNHNKQGGQDANTIDTSPWKPSYITDDEFSVQMLEALDAFIVVCEVNNEAKIIYSSDTLTNLLNYTGTCNSLKHYDYVSLFDLIAPLDKPQIEKLFFEQSANLNCKQQPEDTENQYQAKYCATNQHYHHPTPSLTQTRVAPPNSRSSATSGGRARSGSGQNEYMSLIVNFRIGLNLSEIKQRHLQQRNSVLQPNGQNRNAAMDTQDHQTPTVELQHLSLPQRVQDIYMQSVSEHESTGAGRSQQSIAEQQQHLLSDGRREEQEHNQHQQQQHQQKKQQQEQQQQQLQQPSQQQQRRQVEQMQKQQQQQAGEHQHLSGGLDGANKAGNGPGGIADGQNMNTDENDQPSIAGSDEASDSNQSQAPVVTGERRHHYRHNHHVNSQDHSHPRRHQKTNSTRQQYEVVRLMATFRGLDGDNVKSEDTSYNRYKFEEPPPFVSKSRYFICIGRLDIPRFSYDLKIIVPPMRGGSNVFHNNQFLSKHTLKWRFLWVDDRAPAIIGYLPFEVLGTSGYDYYHWDDLDKLVISHEGLMRDGQASSGPYRFLTKGQQWIWLQTKYCIILKPQYYAEQRKKQLHNQYLDKIEANMVARSEPVSETHAKCSTRVPANQLQQPHQQHQSTAHMVLNNDDYQAPLSYNESSIFGASTIGQAAYQESVQQVDYTDSLSYYDQGKYTTTYADTNQLQQHQNANLTYSDMPVDGPILTKKFRSGEENLANYRQSSMDESHDLGDQYADQQTGEQQYSEKANNLQQNEQRRYEKLLKSNDLIKRESIKAGNSFSSRSLDQFKFILCTHTVIGFDESDGYVNSTASDAK